MSPAPSPKDCFDRWYKAPLLQLRSLPNGDGAFVALAVSCFLYERYAVAYLKSTNTKASDDAKRAQFASDFAIDDDTAKAYWSVIRNEFLHQGMGLQQDNKGTDFPSWSVSEQFPRVQLDKGPPSHLKLQPWLICGRVVEVWDNRPDLIDANESFPWARIWQTVAPTQKA